MEKVPDWFQEQFRWEFPHLRIRWSVKRKTFVIEQKVGRAAYVPFKVEEDDDDTIRARDGYVLMMEVRAGDRMPCPKCGMTLKVPHLRVTEVHCPRCRAKKVDTRVYAGFFPLNESLLEELRWGDPYRGGIERQLRYVKDALARQVKADDSLAKDERADAMFGALIHQIPKVGYTTSQVFTGS